MKKSYGVGINDYNGAVRIDGKVIKSYRDWQNMLRRCYDSKYQELYPTYADCTVCEDWLKFSKFKEWFDANYPQHLEEQGVILQLDKDLLGKDSKIYSPDTCVFLPSCVNSFIINKEKNNKLGHYGAHWQEHAKKWRVRINDFHSYKSIHVGYFNNIEDAKNAYIKARAVEAEKAKGYLRGLGYNEDIVNKIK